MRFKFFLIGLLLIPELASAACCCFPRQLPGWWASADYLLVWRKKRFYPPLVTTAPVGFEPNLGLPTTSILFGDETVGQSPKSGGRFDLGLWLSGCLGVGGGGFAFAEEHVDYRNRGNSVGLPILGRPITDAIQAGAQNNFPISFPSEAINGLIDINTTNGIWGGDFYGRYRVFCSGCTHIDFLGGFMYTRVDDNLEIFSSFTDIMAPPDDFFEFTDCFDVDNNYYGALLGFNAEFKSRCWGAQVIGKVGIGGMCSDVTISGNTSVTTLGVTDTFEGGLLALPTNIGSESQRRFSVVPQLNANVQYRLWGCSWVRVGYDLIYWPRVVLAGEQIDLDVNVTQIFGGALVGPQVPTLDIKDKSFWVQGLSVGLYAFY